jgi:hypothetical protein
MKHQAELLFDNDMVILDPLQPNISAGLKELCGKANWPAYITGRLDLTLLIGKPTNNRIPESFIVSSMDKIMSTVSSHFQAVDGSSNVFNSILLAGWEVFPVPVLHELSNVLANNGLGVFLETSGPDFLQHPNILAAAIAGLVIRNALMDANGDRRDCFDMKSLRSTVKSFVSQGCLRNFAVLAWETLDNDTVPSIAVLRRTHTWCEFYSAVPWIGSTNALFDLSIATLTLHPLSAFDWLKEHRVLELHDIWRSNRVVSIPKLTPLPSSNEIST